MRAETVEVDFPAGRRLRVLEHRSALHVHATWEELYVEALVALLRPGNVVFDIGAEEGESSALIGTLVGGESVHIFEPTPTVWPNIRAVWEANGLAGPGGTWQGFVSAESRDATLEARCGPGRWPVCSLGPLQPDGRFSVVHERPDIPAITLDEYVARVGIGPDVLAMDVEGAEILVIDGAERVLLEHRPLVFVSIHCHETIARFGPGEAVPEQERHQQLVVFERMDRVGYVGRWLDTDHEGHWLFYPAERAAEIDAALGGRVEAARRREERRRRMRARRTGGS